MIGLMFFAIWGLWLIAYLYLLCFTVRYVKRKNGSNMMAALAVIGVLIVTFGSEIFNSWYHKQVLCKREEVGLHIFERVPLPAIYTNPETGKPLRIYINDKTGQPDSEMSEKNPIFARFEIDEKTGKVKNPDPFFYRFEYSSSLKSQGVYWSQFNREERKLLDLESGRVLARYVNYTDSSSLWWLKPLDWFDENSLIGWIRSRDNSPSCFTGPRTSLAGLNSYFFEVYKLGREKK